ncbi:MAG: glycosyltransferase family 2 protein [Candidatus Omnitrophica bacterium]|nr:glycosyltransferase family 2 protein [Candidatus Omnitrophota bacterium]
MVRAPVISVVIVVWNELELVLSCVASVLRQSIASECEIIVVVNGLEKNIAQAITRTFPTVTIIQNKINRGVACARNQGIASARGDYIALLDADTELEHLALEQMKRFMEDHPSVGLLGPKLVSAQGALQFSCRRHHSLLSPLMRRLSFLRWVTNSRAFKQFHMSDWGHDEARIVEQVIGACQFIRASAQQKIGLLDKRMFYGWEDSDYCIRMQKAGYQVAYVPEAVVKHFEQRLTKSNLFSRLGFENVKSMILFFMKYPGAMFGVHG